MPDKFSSRKHSANPLAILVHLQLVCAQRGKELELTVAIGSLLVIFQRPLIQSFHPSATGRLAGIPVSNYAPR